MSDSEKSVSLINFDGLSQIGCALLDKISSAVGWVATHDTPNRIAVKQYIEDIQNSDLDPILKAAKISRAKRDIKEYCNQAKIISDAIPQLDSTSDPSKLDDDWLFMFMDKARLVNSESLQAIWSRILAQECNESNSIPKRLLHILSVISPRQANAFKIVCQFLVRIFLKDKSNTLLIPIISSFHPDKTDIYSRSGLSYYDLQELDSLGLLQFLSTHHYLEFGHSCSAYRIIIENKIYRILNPNHSSKLDLGIVLLTFDGIALCSIIEHTSPSGLLEECKRLWKEQNNISILEVCEDQAETATADTATPN